MAERPVLLYDHDCSFCRRWVGWAEQRGADVEFMPCQDAAELRQAWDVTDATCSQTAVYIDAKGPLTHADAINAVLRRMPQRRWRLAGRLGHAPITHILENVGYRIIAKNRHRLRGPKGQDRGMSKEDP